MTASADLRVEVLQRMHALGADRVLTPSLIARHGETRSVGAVWRCLDDLWEDELVDHLGEEKYRLARPRVGVQTTIELTAPADTVRAESATDTRGI